jgi:hypothetical protein
MLDYILNPDFNAETVFHKKYASKKHMKSSIYVRHWALKNWPESADGTGEDRGRELWMIMRRLMVLFRPLGRLLQRPLGRRPHHSEALRPSTSFPFSFSSTRYTTLSPDYKHHPNHLPQTDTPTPTSTTSLVSSFVLLSLKRSTLSFYASSSFSQFCL